jgi:hypothetical protein
MTPLTLLRWQDDTALHKDGLRQMEFPRIPENGENSLTFIKLEAVQMPPDCCIPETDSAARLSYACRGIRFL